MNAPDETEDIGNSVSWLIVIGFASVVVAAPFVVAWAAMAIHLVD